MDAGSAVWSRREHRGSLRGRLQRDSYLYGNRHPGPPGKIVVDSGNDQIGAVNQPLPRPLIAVVVDSGNNRLAGVPVTFTVTQGDGSVAGQTSPSGVPVTFTAIQEGGSIAGQPASPSPQMPMAAPQRR